MSIVKQVQGELLSARMAAAAKEHGLLGSPFSSHTMSTGWQSNTPLTVYVLVGGAFGGLVLTIIVILCCKFCARSSKPSRRRPSCINQVEEAQFHSSDHSNTSTSYRELRRQPAVDVEDGTIHLSNPLLDEALSEHPEYKDRPRRSSTASREADEALPKRWFARTSPKGAFSPQLSGESILHIDHDAQSSIHSNQISPSLSSPSPEGWMEKNKIIAEVHGTSAHIICPIPDPLFLQPNLRREDSVISAEEVELQEMWAQPPMQLRMESPSELHSGWSMVRELQRSAASLDSWKVSRSRSFESGELCEILEHRQRENAHWLRRQASLSDDDAEPPGKVRYNDTGSLEAVSDACLDLSVEQLPSLYCQSPKQYKELWELRTTLELESSHEDFSRTVYSGPVLHATTSEDVESQIDSGDEEEDEEEDHEKEIESAGEGMDDDDEEIVIEPGDVKLTDNRSLRNLPRDDSFESDESLTDASRFDQVAASFDSTTEGTSKGNHKLQQMKADSGYKSMESSVRAPKLSYTAVIDDDAIRQCEDDESISMSVKRHTRTWSKRRREYFQGKEACVDYTDEAAPNLFTRIFRAPPRRYFTRDFSVDKKSDQLFREFSRCDPTFDPISVRSRSRYRRRYHHRHFDADSLSPRRKLSPQDSIEEEDCCVKSVMSLPEDAQSNQSDAQTTISDVPIIHAK